jgi:hypothetical protein
MESLDLRYPIGKFHFLPRLATTTGSYSLNKIAEPPANLRQVKITHLARAVERRHQQNQSMLKRNHGNQRRLV